MCVGQQDAEIEAGSIYKGLRERWVRSQSTMKPGGGKTSTMPLLILFLAGDLLSFFLDTF